MYHNLNITEFLSLLQEKREKDAFLWYKKRKDEWEKDYFSMSSDLQKKYKGYRMIFLQCEKILSFLESESNSSVDKEEFYQILKYCVDNYQDTFFVLCYCYSLVTAKRIYFCDDKEEGKKRFLYKNIDDCNLRKCSRKII